MPTFSWVVGVDLSAHSHGALRFADWLHRRTRALGHRFDVVHVIERQEAATRYPGGRPLEERALRLTGDCVQAVRARAAIRSMSVVRADLAADGLATRMLDDGAGLIIGRAGANEGWSPLSLGGTTRTLLRTLPGPLCVVPADLDVARLDPGPLFVSLETDDSCVGALRFALGLGRQIGRPVIAVHGDGDARERIEAWCEKQRLPVPGLRLEAVSTTAAVVNDAEAERACMIVCGATRLSLAHRSVHETVGMRLAALAPCPVLVVPPHFRTAARTLAPPAGRIRAASGAGVSS